jgi:hypothetical protein
MYLEKPKDLIIYNRGNSTKLKLFSANSFFCWFDLTYAASKTSDELKLGCVSKPHIYREILNGN